MDSSRARPSACRELCNPRCCSLVFELCWGLCNVVRTVFARSNMEPESCPRLAEHEPVPQSLWCLALYHGRARRIASGRCDYAMLVIDLPDPLGQTESDTRDRSWRRSRTLLFVSFRSLRGYADHPRSYSNRFWCTTHIRRLCKQITLQERSPEISGMKIVVRW